MPPKGKHKNANQHEKRHDTGLAPPGKRITKDQVSSRSANGHTNGKPIHNNNNPPPPLPSTGLNQGLTFSHSQPNSIDSVPLRDSDDRIDTEREGRQNSLPTEVASEDSAREMGSPAPGERISSEMRCAGEGTTLRSLASQASSSLALAATILRSCPIRDAIAILILLLSLPPTLIITVHTLFASLTFVPPSAGLTWSSWSSYHALGDWFHATPGSGPSPFTIIFSDVFMTLVYLLLPLQIQNVLLDLGQAVIAISLSGATADKESSSNSVALCTTIIGISHVLRYKAFHITGLDYLRAFLHNFGIAIPGDPSASSSFVPATGILHGWFRLLLGCHILAQGILTLLRRSLAGVSRPQPIRKQDPEAASFSDGAKGSSSSAETNPETPPNASTDGRPPGPSPAVRDSKERVSNSKKKRKQANQVRSQQPLWAAIASTKVTFLKEIEQKQASTDAIEASSGDSSKTGLASAILQDDRIWVVDIHSTEVTFKADLSTITARGESANSETASSISPGIDKSKPFYVRLNGADWGSTKIVGVENGEGLDDKGNRLWNGEIYGLAPLTKYSCEFVKLSNQEVICSVSLITLPAPSTEQTSTVPVAPQHQSLRPLSPTSTLKQSISSAEVKREEVRNKLKRTRKDHKTAASSVRKETDQLNSKVASSGGQDERQKQRILQLKQHVKQAEDGTIALKAELDGLGEIPDEDLNEAAKKKRSWESACEVKSDAAAEVETAKSEANKEVSQLHAELASAMQKRDRLSVRRSKVSEQYDRLVSEQHANLSNRQRYDEERARIREDRQKTIEQILYWTQQSRMQAENLNIRANEFFQEGDFLSSQLQRQQASISGPTTPEGNLPGTNGPPLQQPPGFEFSMFNMAPTHNTSGPNWGGRLRSSSMLSGYSGFTDDLDVPVSNGADERKKSEGSSDSANSNGEAMSPPPAARSNASPGPIGPPSAYDKAKGRASMNAIGSNR